MSQGYRKYSQAYQKAAVNTVDQRKLIVLLYEGAIKYLSIAVKKIGEGDYYESHTNLVRGKSIIAELLASLNMEQGGDIAANLQRLYAYIFNELIDANMQKDAPRIEQVILILRDLKDAWKDLQDPKPTNTKENQPVDGNSRTKKINLQG